MIRIKLKVYKPKSAELSNVHVPAQCRVELISYLAPVCANNGQSGVSILARIPLWHT